MAFPAWLTPVSPSPRGHTDMKDDKWVPNDDYQAAMNMYLGIDSPDTTSHLYLGFKSYLSIITGGYSPAKFVFWLEKAYIIIRQQTIAEPAKDWPVLLRRETLITIYIAGVICGQILIALRRRRGIATVTIGVATGVRFVTKDFERLNWFQQRWWTLIVFLLLDGPLSTILGNAVFGFGPAERRQRKSGRDRYEHLLQYPNVVFFGSILRIGSCYLTTSR